MVGSQADTLNYSVTPANQGVLTLSGSSTPVSVSGGQLGGLLTLRNQTLPGYTSSLNDLAGTLAQQVDNVQATGLFPEPVGSLHFPVQPALRFRTGLSTSPWRKPGSPFRPRPGLSMFR